MAASGGERKQDRAQSHNRTPPFKERLPEVSPKQESKSRGGIAGQARVAAEGLEMEVDRRSRVVAAEQEARKGPAEQGV